MNFSWKDFSTWFLSEVKRKGLDVVLLVGACYFLYAERINTEAKTESRIAILEAKIDKCNEQKFETVKTLAEESKELNKKILSALEKR